MKNLVFYSSLVVLLISLITAGCKKDKSEPIVGKWEFLSCHADTIVNNIIIDDSTINYNPGDRWIEFYDDNTGYVKNIGATANFTWSVNGNEIMAKVAGQAPLYLIYILEEPKLTWTVTFAEGDDWPNPGDHYKLVLTEILQRMQK